MKNVNTVAEVQELDWEIPVEDFDTLLARGLITSEAIEVILNAFEKFNGVCLDGEALDYFEAGAEDFYTEK